MSAEFQRDNLTAHMATARLHCAAGFDHTLDFALASVLELFRKAECRLRAMLAQ
jgi:hypothetical protein